jgi:hypothetical protein
MAASEKAEVAIFVLIRKELATFSCLKALNSSTYIIFFVHLTIFRQKYLDKREQSISIFCNFAKFYD